MVGETARAETWILDFEQRIETLANTYGESIAGTTYTTLSYQPGQRQFHMVTGHDLDLAFQQIGLTRPSEQTDITPVGVGGLRRADISLERLDLIDTDLLFFYNYQYPNIQRVDELPELSLFLEQEPLLRRLQAIETRRAFVVPANYWFLGRSMGIPLVVDDLEAAVLPLLT
ncbi:hypothetical protein [Vacuolonema iberomarrocanum]|uniref:hypothetical protein n=1 Tax=Vacuolonema iberomarrocanum TaxID=3454632 RepID=UPI001A04ED16|nr:hypothetical protein [filamentous cyanobacterium LEGE 07170]